MNGWKIPTPYQLWAALVVLATAALMAGTFRPGSKLETIATFLVAVASLTGMASAAKYIPPRVQTILAAHDETVKAALATTPPAPAQEPAPAPLVPENQTGSNPILPGTIKALLPLAFLFWAGCSPCTLAANIDTFRCVAEREILDCGGPAIAKLAVQYGPAIFAALTGSSPDADMQRIEDELKAGAIGNGYALIHCVIADLQRKQTAQAGSTLAQRADAWKAKHPAKVVGIK